MKRKSRCLAGLAVILCITVLIGCGGKREKETKGDKEGKTEQTQESSQKEESQNRKKKVVVWTWTGDQFAQAEQRYFETHPDADWEFEQVNVPSEDYLTKLQQSYASGGSMPDMLLAEMSWRASAFKLDVWENLEQEPYNFDRSIVYDNVISQITDEQDQVIGLENAVNPAFMMYKRDLAKKYLGTDDREELEKMFQTYDDYIQVGQKVYEESGGKVHIFAGLQDVANMMYQQKRNENNVDGDGNLNVIGKVTPIFKTLEKMRENNICADNTMYSTEWYNAIADKETIFFPGASWSVTYWVEAYDTEGAKTGNWGMFTPAEGGFSWGGTCYGIYKNSEVKEELWDFLSWWLLSEEGALVMKEGAGFFLPVKSLYDDPEYTAGVRQSFGDQEINKFMTEEIAPNISDASLSIYDSLVGDSVNMVAEMMGVDGSLDAERALEEFEDDLEAKVPEIVIR